MESVQKGVLPKNKKLIINRLSALIVGIPGFVGSHLLKELLSRGYNVTAIARSTSKIEIKNGNPKVVNVDINDVKALTEVIKGNDIETFAR